MHVVDMVYFWARTIPHQAAIIRPEGIVTYAALAEAVETAAENFARLILDRDKPVAAAIESPAGMLVASLGLQRAGFSIVPVSKPLLEHLPQIGVTTMVCERGGLMLADGTNILFEDSWLTVGTGVSARKMR